MSHLDSGGLEPGPERGYKHPLNAVPVGVLARIGNVFVTHVTWMKSALRPSTAQHVRMLGKAKEKYSGIGTMWNKSSSHNPRQNACLDEHLSVVVRQFE